VSSSPSSGDGPGWDNYELMSAAEAELMTIDSSTPYLWLPEPVCLKFEKALGIVYDNHMQVYVYPNGSTDSLQNWNLTFTFTLADLPQTVQAKQVNITLPFNAFNLQLSYPSPLLVNATNQSPMVNYFPLRKAANNTQYTLGRVFLQEAYLKLDYERNNFSVYQAVFTPDALTNINIVSIPSNSTQSGGGKERLSTGDIAGIAVGGAIVLIGAGVGFYLWRRSPPEKMPAGADGGEKKPRRSWLAGLGFSKKSREGDETTVELEADHRLPVEAPEGVQRMELEGQSYPPVELQGDEVYSGASNKGGGSGGTAVSAYEESNRKLYRSELHEDTAGRPTKRDDGTAVVGGVQEHYYPATRYPVSPPLGRYHPVPQSPYSPTTISDDGQIHRSNSRNSRFREEMVPNSDNGGGTGHQEQSQDRLSPACGWTPGR
jgi:hypothetical protein